MSREIVESEPFSWLERAISWVVLGGKPTVVGTVVLVGFEVVGKMAIFHFLKRSREGWTSVQNGGIDHNWTICTVTVKHGFANRLTGRTTHKLHRRHGPVHLSQKMGISPERERERSTPWGSRNGSPRQ